MRIGAALPFVLLLLAGCRVDPSIELLESELRWMEDQVYLLDRELTLSKAQLESCRRNNQALRDELNRRSPDGSTTGASPAPLDTPTGAPRVDEPDVPYPDEEFDEDDLLIPDIDLGPDFQDESSSMPDDTPVEGGTAAYTTSQVASNVAVARIVLNPRLTGGYDFDRKYGDDGIMVVVEPQNTRGQFVPLPGQLSVILSDPTRSGIAGRVARWDFDAAETSRLMKRSLLGKGIHLKLPWPDRPPRVHSLRLHVWYTTTDGRHLTDYQTIRIDLPNEGTMDKTASEPYVAPLIPREQASDIISTELRQVPPAPDPQRVSSRRDAEPLPAWSPFR